MQVEDNITLDYRLERLKYPNSNPKAKANGSRKNGDANSSRKSARMVHEEKMEAIMVRLVDKVTTSMETVLVEKVITRMAKVLKGTVEITAEVSTCMFNKIILSRFIFETEIFVL
jgi:hypothetical protein